MVFRQILSIDVAEGQPLDIGLVVLEEDQTQEQQLSLITITENDLGDDNSGSESTAGFRTKRFKHRDVQQMQQNNCVKRGERRQESMADQQPKTEK